MLKIDEVVKIRQVVRGAVVIEPIMDTSDATAEPSDIVLGATAFARGERIVGTLQPAEGVNF